jgi:hypothetical protein
MDYSLGGNKFFDEKKTISDLTSALDSIAEVIRQHGPFDGVIGFSSGACIAALIASLLEDGRKQEFDKGNLKMECLIQLLFEEEILMASATCSSRH